jgi:voltage-gated potassium channel
MYRGEIIRLGDELAAIRCPQCPSAGEDVNDIDSYKLRMHMLMDHPESSTNAAFLQYYMINMIILATFKLVFFSVRQYSGWSGWTVIEVWISLSFLAEYIFRLIASHNRIKFWFNVYNIIDFLAILPFFFMFVPNLDSLRVFRLVRVIRVFRLLKLSRHVKFWELLQATIDNCKAVLSLLWFLFAGFVVVMATIVYNVELGMWDDDKNAYVNADGTLTQVTNIPAGIYWCVQTITGTAYGDVLTLNVFGKFFAILTMILGVTFLSLSVAVVSTSFATVYKAEVNKQKRLVEMVRKQGAYFDNVIDHQELAQVQQDTNKKLESIYETLKANGDLDARRDRHWKAALASISAQLDALIADAGVAKTQAGSKTVATTKVELESKQ